MEYKFRGKSKDGVWRYGNLVIDKEENKYYICPQDYKYGQIIYEPNLFEEVDPATVGMYTGVKDKNGTEIYDGDYWATSNDGSEGADEWDEIVMGPVLWSKYYLGWSGMTERHQEESIYSSRYAYVIGNIHDNKELVEG